MEDLIRHYGLQQNVITLAPTSSRYIPFQSISVSWSIKKVSIPSFSFLPPTTLTHFLVSTIKVGLLVTDSKGRKKLLLEVTRYEKEEPLEICAKRIVKELAKILQRTVTR